MSDRQEEIEALARLAGDELGGAVDGIAAVHRAVSDHVFAAVRLGVGPAARPAQVVHDTIADNVYRIVSGSAVAAGTLAGHAATFSEVPTPSRTVFGSGLLAALQGLIGDTLAQQRPILAAPMAFRSDGDPVEPERLVEHITNPSSRVVIFLHGLAQT